MEQGKYVFTYMWNLKKTQMNKRSKTETNSEIQRTDWRLLGAGGRVKWMKGVKCMGMDGN